MGLFGKKKPVENSKEETDVKTVKAMGKRKTDGLSSILDETVPAAVIEEFKKIPNFCTEIDGVDVYVGIALNVEDIGGLSKKDKKDEAKGAIVEAINTGRFARLLTPDLMEENTVVFIPTRETIEDMQEFSVLNRATYKLCYVETGDDPDILDIEVSLDDIKTLHDDEEHIDKLLVIDEDDNDSDTAQDNDDEDDDDTSNDEPAEDYDTSVTKASDDTDASDEDDELPFGGGADDDGTGYGVDLSAQDATIKSESYENAAPVIDMGDDDDMVLTPDEEEDYFEEVEIDDGSVETVVTRVFYSEDLGLEVSTAPFDAKFVTGNNAPLLITERGQDGTGGLADIVAQMAIDANAELRQLHKDNIFKLRSMYSDLCNIQSERILELVSTRNPNTVWSEQLDAIKLSKLEQEDMLPEKVAAEKKVLEAKWNETLTRVGEEASRIAKQQHIDRFGRQYEESLDNIETLLRDSVNHDFENSKRALVAAQRQEALSYMDTAVNEILRELADMYEPIRKSEEDRFHQLQTEIKKYEDKYRSDESQRVLVLERELKLNSSVEKIRREAAAEIEQAQASIKLRRDEFENQKAQLDTERQAAIERITAECESRIQTIRAENDRMAQIMADVKTKAAEDVAQALAEADKRVADMKKDIRDAENKSDVILEEHHRSRNRMVKIIIIASLAMLAVGAFVGWKMGDYLPFGQTFMLPDITGFGIGGIF